MKKHSSAKPPKRNAQVTATPYTSEKTLSNESQKKIHEEFMKCIEGTISGVYCTRK